MLRSLNLWPRCGIKAQFLAARHLSWSDWPATDVEQEIEQRRRFWELERLRDSVLEYDNLSEQEKAVHEAHKEAVRLGHFTYEDPLGGGTIETRYKHFLTGLCCGAACRHCTFNFYNVPKYLKATKTFNSSFWTDTSEKGNVNEPTLNLKQFSLRRKDFFSSRKQDEIGKSSIPDNCQT